MEMPEDIGQSLSEPLVATCKSPNNKLQGSLVWSLPARLPSGVLWVSIVGNIVLIAGVVVLAIQNVDLEGIYLEETAAPNPPTQNALRFAQFTDIHTDPFYAANVSSRSLCRQVTTGWSHDYWHNSPLQVKRASIQAPLARAGCDPPLALIKSASTAAAALGDFDFVIVTGDLVAHGISAVPGYTDIKDNMALRLEVIGNTSEAITEAFAGIPVFSTFGNNDVPYDCVSPYCQPGGSQAVEYMSRVLDRWRPGIECNDCSAQAKPSAVNLTDFIRSGSYTATISGVTLVMLNTIPLCQAGDASTCTNDATHAEEIRHQFDWLEGTLKQARMRQEAVYIFGHVPPVFSSYNGAPQWNKSSIRTFQGLMDEYKTIVKATIFGHTHTDEIRVLSPAPGVHVPLYIAPALTPDFLGNPGFRVYELDMASKVLSNFWQYFAPLADLNSLMHNAWRLEYDFQATFGEEREDKESKGQSLLSGDTMQSIATRIRTSPLLAGMYRSHMQVSIFDSFATTMALRCSRLSNFIWEETADAGEVVPTFWPAFNCTSLYQYLLGNSVPSEVEITLSNSFALLQTSTST